MINYDKENLIDTEYIDIEKRDEIENDKKYEESNGIFQSIKNFIYYNWNIISIIIIVCCFGWILYSINTGNKPDSNGVEQTISDLRGEISSLKQQLSKVSGKIDTVGKTNSTIQNYNYSIQESQRQTSEELGKVRESLQSATERAQSINERNKQAESGLRDMQNVLSELREQQSEFDRLINQAESITEGTRKSN